MTEPTIICPNCRTEIKPTESLAAPLLEATRRDFEQRQEPKGAGYATLGNWDLAWSRMRQ